MKLRRKFTAAALATTSIFALKVTTANADNIQPSHGENRQPIATQYNRSTSQYRYGYHYGYHPVKGVAAYHTNSSFNNGNQTNSNTTAVANTATSSSSVSDNTSTANSSTSTSSSSSTEEAAKEWIAQKESGGSYTAQNGQYYGKYQLTLSYLNGDLSAANQEKVANQYVASRYGSWVAAKTHWETYGWY